MTWAGIHYEVEIDLTTGNTTTTVVKTKEQRMTPYRDRLNAGEYTDANATPTTKKRKRQTTKRAATKRSSKKTT